MATDPLTGKPIVALQKTTEHPLGIGFGSSGGAAPVASSTSAPLTSASASATASAPAAHSSRSIAGVLPQQPLFLNRTPSLGSGASGATPFFAAPNTGLTNPNNSLPPQQPSTAAVNPFAPVPQVFDPLRSAPGGVRPSPFGPAPTPSQPPPATVVSPFGPPPTAQPQSQPSGVFHPQPQQPPQPSSTPAYTFPAATTQPLFFQPNVGTPTAATAAFPSNAPTQLPPLPLPTAQPITVQTVQPFVPQPFVPSPFTPAPQPQSYLQPQPQPFAPQPYTSAASQFPYAASPVPGVSGSGSYAPVAPTVVVVPAAPVPVLTEAEELTAELTKFFRGTIPVTRSNRLEVNKVSRDEAGLKQLASSGSWRAIITCAEQILEDDNRRTKEQATKLRAKDTAGAGAIKLLPPDVAFRIVNYQIAALMKLKRFDQAQTALLRLGDLFGNDKRYDSFPQLYPALAKSTVPTATAAAAGLVNRSGDGSMIPFNLFLLHAELPHCFGKTQLTIAALQQLMNAVEIELFDLLKYYQTTKSAPVSAAGDRWHVLHRRWRSLVIKLINYHIQPTAATVESTAAAASAPAGVQSPTSAPAPQTVGSADYASAVQLIQQLISRHVQLVSYAEKYKIVRSAAAGGGDSKSDASPPASAGDSGDLELYSFLGRIYLQFGDVPTATATFARATGATASTSAAASSPAGVVSDAAGELNRALLAVARNEYEAAYNQLSALVKRTAPTAVMLPGTVPSSAPASFHSLIVNNFAICALHNNKISVAVTALEDLLRADPINHLSESVVNNLRTLYDLSSSSPALKKRVLDGIIYLFGSDELETHSSTIPAGF